MKRKRIIGRCHWNKINSDHETIFFFSSFFFQFIPFAKHFFSLQLFSICNYCYRKMATATTKDQRRFVLVKRSKSDGGKRFWKFVSLLMFRINFRPSFCLSFTCSFEFRPFSFAFLFCFSVDKAMSEIFGLSIRERTRQRKKWNW